MKRAALTILFFGCFLTACTKSNETGLAAYNARKVIDDQIIADYLKANPTLDAKKIDTSGVYYITVVPGTGNDLFTNSTTVTVGYEGRLLTTGQVFAKTNDFHPSFPLQTVIKVGNWVYLKVSAEALSGYWCRRVMRTDRRRSRSWG
jgi:FKBP-type peptidyl-prolyl cis-trans isomerase FkpA